MKKKYKWKQHGKRTAAILFSAILLGNTVNIPNYAQSEMEADAQNGNGTDTQSEDGAVTQPETKTDTSEKTAQKQRRIVRFGELPEEIRMQHLPLGASEEEINFPDTLTVTVKTSEKILEEENAQKPENEIPEGTDSEASGNSDTEESDSEAPGSSDAEESDSEAPGSSDAEGSDNEAPGSSDTEKSDNEAPDSSNTVESDTETGTDESNSPENTEETKEAEKEAGKDDTEESVGSEALLDFLFGPSITVHAAESEETDVTEEITLTGITWTLLPEESTGEFFDAGIAPEEYFGLDDEGELMVTEELLESYEDKTGAVYTYVPILPAQDSEGTDILLSEEAVLPEITVQIGDPQIMLLADDAAADDVAIDETNFPNEAFRKYVKENFDTNKDGKLSTTEANSVTYLSVAKMNTVTDLTGLKHFPNLDNLECNDSGITTLDVSENPKLRILNCSDTEISNLDFSNNPKLWRLYCGNTQISSLDVTANTNLDQLNCGNNSRLISLNLQGSRNLRLLYCANNPSLSSLDIRSNVLLTSVDCSKTQISELDVSNNTALETLSFSNTPITNMDVSSNTCLTELFGYGSSLTTLELGTISGLTMLECHETNLKSLDVSHLTNLQVLRCFGTDLTTLDVSSNTALITLDCSKTKISSLDVSNNTALVNLTVDYTEISELNVQNNALIIGLYCSHTPISSLDISNLPKLYSLRCNDTQIDQLDVSNKPALKTLECYNTNISSLDVSSTPNLGSLYCYNTKISSLDVSQNNNLTYLNCQKCPLASLKIGNNNKLSLRDMASTITVTVDKSETSFNLAEKVSDIIDIAKVNIISGGTLTDGILSGYVKGTPVVYEYDSGISNKGSTIHTVTLIIDGLADQGQITITEDPNNLSKTYDGQPVNDAPAVDTHGSTGAVTYTWERKTAGATDTADTYETIDGAPTDAGEYRVTAHLAEDDTHTAADSDPVTFTITKADAPENKPQDGTAPLVLPEGSEDPDSTLPEGWSWKEGEILPAPGTIGTMTAVYRDTANYDNAEVTLTVARPAAIMKGSASRYTLRSGQSVKLSCNAAANILQSLSVDGTAIDAKDYTVDAQDDGSSVITLGNAYLDTLEEGTHTIVLSYPAGDVTATLTVNRRVIPTPETKPSETESESESESESETETESEMESETPSSESESETPPSESESETSPTETESETLPSETEYETLPSETEFETQDSETESETDSTQKQTSGNNSSNGNQSGQNSSSAGNSGSPKTGDSSPVEGYSILLLAAAAVLLLTAAERRRKNE